MVAESRIRNWPLTPDGQQRAGQRLPNLGTEAAGDDSHCMHWHISNLAELRGSRGSGALPVGQQLLSGTQAGPVAARSTASRPEGATAGAACSLRCCAQTAGVTRGEAGRGMRVCVGAWEIETARWGEKRHETLPLCWQAGRLSWLAG